MDETECHFGEGGCSNELLDRLIDISATAELVRAKSTDRYGQTAYGDALRAEINEHFAGLIAGASYSGCADQEEFQNNGRSASVLNEIEGLAKINSPGTAAIMDAYVSICNSIESHRSLLLATLNRDDVNQQHLFAINRVIDAKLNELDREVLQALVRLRTSFLDTRPRRQNHPPEVVAVLQKWFDDHLAEPYPTEDEKNILALQCNLEPEQVGNWFSNKRNRNKKTSP